MAQLRAKVRNLLRNGFPRPDEILLDPEDGDITGVVVSRRFRGLPSDERVRMIHAALDPKLNPDERRQVVLFFAMTPEEAKARPDLLSPNGHKNSA